ncbi:hypothetical protein ACP275_06G134600 [Erythranthe tilingii]
MGSQRNSGKQKINQVKASWTPENHELFIDLCLEQISIGNKPGTHLTKNGWNNLLGSFHSITGIKYERIQLKNHWDMTKKNWKIWHDLVSTEWLKWDPVERSFGASEQEWDQYIRENPDAAQFRSKELLFADKLNIVFGGAEDYGVRKRRNCGTRKISCYTRAEPISVVRKHNNYPGNNTYMHVEEEPMVGNGNDAVESRSGVTVQSPPHKLSYSIEECIKGLDSIEELEQGCELYLFGLDIFLKKEYREIFLNLKKSSTRIAWLERLQSSNSLPLN